MKTIYYVLTSFAAILGLAWIYLGIWNWKVALAIWLVIWSNNVMIAAKKYQVAPQIKKETNH